MRARQGPKRVILGVAALALLGAIPVINAVRPDAARAATTAPGDGTTSITAGASCWGIKQQYPASTDGLYWLLTNGLQRPSQFRCDMTTAGGGWVLVGRGRQGWTFSPTGQGSPTTLRTTSDGAGAFAPAALDTSTIAGLLNGVAVSDLTDGIRLERATTADGTGRQDYRLFPKYRNWTWSLHGGQLLNQVTVNGTTYAGSNTYDTLGNKYGQTANGLAGHQGTDRLFTWPWVNHASQKGFSFGDGVAGGSNAASSFLWTSTTENDPIPFTRVWVRPRIANDAAGFTPIPSNGFPAEPKASTLKNRSELAAWGVVGLDHTNEPNIEPYNTTVLQLKVVGDTTFVGGRFSGVQNGPTASPIAQKYLASFDLDGNWRSGFRPVLDGRVWDMVPTPDGKLIIAGDFTSVNGAPNTSGIAKIDPVTGAVVAGFKANATKMAGARPLVRALDITGDTVYAAGSFTTFTGGTYNPITVSSAISFRSTDGQPGGWRPRLSGSAVRIAVSQAGDRVLMGGYFNAVNGDANHGYFAITDAGTGVPVPGIGPWQPSVGSNAKYQQAVADLGDGRILVGGSEHDFQLYNRDRTTLIDSNITKQGGDLQAIAHIGNKLYMGCHCTTWLYQGTNNWSSPSGFRSIDPINLVGQLDASTFEYDTSWYPSSLKGVKSEGVWAIDGDSRGCLWVGGDLVRGGYSGNVANDWLGGFARFCATDSTPPTAPSDLRSTVNGSSVTLNWGASTDASGAVSYDVYRNDRVIATVWGTTFTDPEVSGNVRYTVRATDATGNRSASPAPIAINGPAPKIATAVAFGSAWRYADSGADLGTAWRAPAFNDSAWPSGPAKLGWGVSDVKTTLSATHPITLYYRSTFGVTNASQVKRLNLGVRDLTGAVVYVNGIEAGRVNMAAGQVTAATTAAGYLTAEAEQATNTIDVAPSLLHDGTNSIAVEVHNMRAGTSRSFFDLEATTYGAGGDVTPPSAPNLSATAGSPNVNLSWTSSVDDVALGGYLITRDGQPRAVTAPTALGYVDGEVDSQVPHRYLVTAFDTSGNVRASNTVSLGAAVDPKLLAWGANWKWSYPGAGEPAGWQATAFDDTAWATGPAEFGFGEGDEKTVISTAPTPRPVTSYYRTTVNITNPSAFRSILAEVIRDDGVVVYVNGVEVGRDNLPAGPIAPSTPATTAITDRTQELRPVPFTIAASTFQPGTNVIAVEIHGNSAYTGDMSFDLRLTGQP
ncbi:MAG: fibrinogen-like YCDxxxxGGGW domain-containing protein [Acidimicrobiales bacterium]